MTAPHETDTNADTPVSGRTARIARRNFLKSAGAVTLAGGLSTTGLSTVVASTSKQTDVYDDFGGSDGYTESDYEDKWNLPYLQQEGGGIIYEEEAIDKRNFDGGQLHLEATPFETWADSTVDHIKYFATSDRTFSIPDDGSIMFSSEIDAETPGTDTSRPICPAEDEDEEECRTVLEGQQAAATLHMLNIHETGALFDWFVAENTAFCLTERLLDPLVPDVGLDRGYTQILREIDISGEHTYGIRYCRDSEDFDRVEWLLDEEVVAKHQKVGIPLDVQKPGKYRDVTWPSIDAEGELLKDKMNSFVIGHGLFSLLDEYPFHPQYEDHFVSYPEDERIFGQGARAAFDDVTVTTEGE